MPYLPPFLQYFLSNIMWSCYTLTSGTDIIDPFRQSRFEKTHEAGLSVIMSWSTQKDRGEKMSKFGKKNKDSKEAEMKKMKQQLEALKKKQAKKK